MAMATPSRSASGTARCEDPCRRFDLCPACLGLFGQRTSVDANERRFPVVGEFEELAEFGVSVYRL